MTKRKMANLKAAARSYAKRERVESKDLEKIFGGEVYVRTLSAAASTHASVMATDDNDKFDAKMYIMQIVARALVDADDNRLVPEGEESAFFELPSRVVAPAQQKAMRLNGDGAEPAGNSLTDGGSSTD